MKLAILSNLFAALSFASPHYGGGGSASQWKPPGHNDYRGPCPMLNTLANHGLIPHDGRNITQDRLNHAFATALNFNQSVSDAMWDMALMVTKPNATWFSLDQLNVHNLLEHDASLSRSDAFFGNNHAFNQTVFNETKQYWTASVLTPEMMVNSKLARQLKSRASNPTYTFTSATEQFSLGEVAAPIIVFGDKESGRVNRSLVEYFFEHERFPTHLGWTRPDVITMEDVSRITELVTNATSLTTPSKSAHANKHKRRNLHFGGGF